MLSSQKLQDCLDEIRQITGNDTALINVRGEIAASTCQLPDPVAEEAGEFWDSLAEQENLAEYSLFKVYVEDELEYVLAMKGSADAVFVIGQMAVCQIRNLVEGFRDQLDRNRYMQNLLLGNLLPVDMVSRAKRLHIEDGRRVVYVIDCGSRNVDVVRELVKNLSNMKAGDFVTETDTASVVLVKDFSETPENRMEAEKEKAARILEDNITMEAMLKVRIGYGSTVDNIRMIPESFKEARLALEVGRVFYRDRTILSYSRLGTGRLIHQLPLSLCNMYIHEVYGDKLPEILSDEETMNTINKFFENNLNISETARQLYLHRNTLVYRLERIQKAIGLDIRVFDDAMTYCIANMVLAHIRDLQKEQ